MQLIYKAEALCSPEEHCLYTLFMNICVAYLTQYNILFETSQVKWLTLSAAILKYISWGQRQEESPQIAFITSQNYLKVKVNFGRRIITNTDFFF